MSNHIKRMLNASLNSSNPSISAHRNRTKVPATKHMKDLNFGSTKIYDSSRPGYFNNTQKINIGSHLECLAALEERDQNLIYAENIPYNMKKTPSSNKFRLMMGKNNESTKYSYLGTQNLNRGLDHILAEYKKLSTKTPSHNSRVHKNTNENTRAEDTNSYYKTQPRNMLENRDNTIWKNMTQKDIFNKDILKMSGVSPASVKN